MEFSDFKELIRLRLKWIKDNIQLVILIPTTLGGIWQLMELSLLSVSFIRFFSISQLIADGLLILFVMSVLALFIQLAKIIGIGKFDKERYENQKVSFLVGSIVGQIGTLIFFCWIVSEPFYDFFWRRKLELMNFGIALAFTYLIFNRLMYSYKLIRYLVTPAKSENKEQKVNGGETSWLVFIAALVAVPIAGGILIFTLGLLLVSIQNFRNQYFLPKELKNLENLDCYFEQTFELSPQDWEIVYFNDKYIFTEIHEKKSSKQLLIIEFQKLLTNDICDSQVEPVLNSKPKYNSHLDTSELNQNMTTERFTFTKYLQSQYPIEKFSKKLQNWHELESGDFLKELNKSIKTIGGEKLSKSDEMEWMEVFETKKKEALELKAEIDKTDKEIDQMVYKLYGLSEEEIKIVENS